MNIAKGTKVRVRTTNGADFIAALVEDYAPTTYMITRRVVVDFPSYDPMLKKHLDYLVIWEYRLKSVEVAE